MRALLARVVLHLDVKSRTRRRATERQREIEREKDRNAKKC